MKSLSSKLNEALNEAKQKKSVEQLAIEYIIGKDIERYHDEANVYAYQLPKSSKWLTIDRTEVNDVVAQHGKSLMHMNESVNEAKTMTFNEIIAEMMANDFKLTKLNQKKYEFVAPKKNKKATIEHIGRDTVRVTDASGSTDWSFTDWADEIPMFQFESVTESMATVINTDQLSDYLNSVDIEAAKNLKPEESILVTDLLDNPIEVTFVDLDKFTVIYPTVDAVTESAIKPSDLKPNETYFVAYKDMEAFAEYKGKSGKVHQFDNSGRIVELTDDEVKKHVTNEALNESVNDAKVPTGYVAYDESVELSKGQTLELLMSSKLTTNDIKAIRAAKPFAMKIGFFEVEIAMTVEPKVKNTKALAYDMSKIGGPADVFVVIVKK